jgi:hypothetical protein
LRQALLGTWRLISAWFDVDGTVFKPFGDNPQGYLVYTPDGHVLVQYATRGERGWPGADVLKLPRHELVAALGFGAYCGTFEVRDGEVIHLAEFGSLPSASASGREEVRSVELDGDRLTLGSPRGAWLEWQRVH